MGRLVCTFVARMQQNLIVHGKCFKTSNSSVLKMLAIIAKSHKMLILDRIAQLVMCLAADTCLTADSGFDPRPVPYFRGD